MSSYAEVMKNPLTAGDCLALFRAARQQTDAAFIASCFTWVNQFLRCDALCVAAAPAAELSFGQALLHNLCDARGVVASYARVGHLDVLTPRAIENPRKAYALDHDDPDIAPPRFQALREHLFRYEIPHACGVMWPDGDNDDVTLFMPLRKRAGDRFEAHELLVAESLAPIVAEAMSIKRSVAWAHDPELEMDAFPIALIDDHGLVKRATQAFRDIYWRGEKPTGYMHVSDACLEQLARGEPWPLHDGEYTLRAVPDERGWLLRLYPASLADTLSTRERQVADAYAAGATYKDIANDLAISPATVRRHLSNLYRKLGIGQKTELIGVLRDAQSSEPTLVERSRS